MWLVLQLTHAGCSVLQYSPAQALFVVLVMCNKMSLMLWLSRYDEATLMYTSRTLPEVFISFLPFLTTDMTCSFQDASCKNNPFK